jgi:hypothetical protein
MRLRAGLPAAAAIAAFAMISAAPASGHSSTPLIPDLLTLPLAQDQVIVTREEHRTLLRLSTEVANHSSGPLEVFPSEVSSDCDGDGDPTDDRDAYQRIFEDSNASGVFEPGADAVFSERLFGCMRYHPAHDHWHVLDFARYELRREPDGRKVAHSRKVGFCLVDTRQAFPGPGSPSTARYPFGGSAAEGCNETATQGISPGWVDSYPFLLPGQDLDVTGLPRGRYCLTSHADPLDLLEELDDANNVRAVRLALRPQRLAVRKLASACRL